jgi:hypothetical protein
VQWCGTRHVGTQLIVRLIAGSIAVAGARSAPQILPIPLQ